MTASIRNRDRVRDLCEVFTPTNIVNEMHNLIPDSIWSDPSMIYIEPACGNGQFLVEAIRMKLENGLTHREACTTVIGIDISQINIDDCHTRIYNVIDSKYIDIIKENIFLVDDTIQYIKDGKLDIDTDNLIVVGNPPYHLSDSGESASSHPLYHKFIETCIDYLEPRYMSMIVPSRWMQGGKGLTEFRERMMNDTRIQTLVDFKKESEVFPDVQIAGGVNYFLWNRDYDGKCEYNGVERYLNNDDHILRNNDEVSIVNKVTKVHSGLYLNKIVAGRKPFGITTNFKDWAQSPLGATRCYYFDKDIHKVQSDKFVTTFKDKNKILNKWKVCTPYAAGRHQEPMKDGTKKVIANIFLIEPDVICTETYIVVNAFNTKSEADNFISYMNTKTFRFLLGIQMSSQHVTRKRFNFVPELTYTTPWDDQSLYQLFNLPPDDIKYIEKTITTII